MAFDHAAGAGKAPNSEAVRAALMDAIAASQTATGKLMAALSMRNTPQLCQSVLADVALQVDIQARSIQRASQLLAETL